MDGSGLSTGDLALMERNSGFGCGNDAFMWIFALLILAGGGFGGMFGGNRGGEQYATTADVQRATDFAALERQNNEIMQNTSSVGAAVTSAVKDGSYNLLGELRDLQGEANTGFANMQKCCCETLRAIDGVNYNGAINTASINANTTAQIQKVLDLVSANRMADMQDQINNLRLQASLNGVVRYPNASTYYAGNNPFCGNGCGCN